MSLISVDLERVRLQAAKFRAAADDHRRAADEIEEVRARLATAWVDPAGGLYQAAAARLISDMRDSADELDHAATDLVEIGARYVALAEKNAQRARGLGSFGPLGGDFK